MAQQTYNHDIKGLAQRIDRITVEINRSASGNVAGVISHDRQRWDLYIRFLRGYHDWIRAEPSPLDLPETHPTLLEVDDPEIYAPVDNLYANDLVRLLVLARAELLSSQSSSLSSGLIDADSKRFLAVLDKCDSLMESSENNPVLDLPESMPHYPGVKAGNRGPHQEPGDTIETP